MLPALHNEPPIRPLDRRTVMEQAIVGARLIEEFTDAHLIDLVRSD